MSDTSDILRRKQAIRALRSIVSHYSAPGIGPVSNPVPPELESAAALLRQYNGLDVTRLILENRSIFPL